LYAARVELIINLTTARTLGLDMPLRFQQLADEVIEWERGLLLWRICRLLALNGRGDSHHICPLLKVNGGVEAIAKDLRNLRGSVVGFQVHIDGVDWFDPLPSFADRWRALQFAKGLLAQVPDEPPFVETVVTVRNQEGVIIFHVTHPGWRFAVAASGEKAYADWSRASERNNGQ
jgi:hypothetical protein